MGCKEKGERDEQDKDVDSSSRPYSEKWYVGVATLGESFEKAKRFWLPSAEKE